MQTFIGGGGTGTQTNTTQAVQHAVQQAATSNTAQAATPATTATPTAAPTPAPANKGAFYILLGGGGSYHQAMNRGVVVRIEEAKLRAQGYTPVIKKYSKVYKYLLKKNGTYIG